MAETPGLSAARLAEIEARCAAATEGPWDTKDGRVWGRGVVFVCPPVAEGGVMEYTFNRRFIAAARTDVPALAAEVRRLRAGLAACREVLETCDWTGPYSELNAARRACGLPEV